MVRYTKANGKTINLDREKFLKLMKILRRRAKANRQERIIAEMTAKW